MFFTHIKMLIVFSFHTLNSGALLIHSTGQIHSYIDGNMSQSKMTEKEKIRFHS